MTHPDNKASNTPALDLFTPANRFVSASKIYGRLHRWRILLGRYWWLPALTVACVLAPVGYLTFRSPPTYESAARMWLTGRLDIRESRLYTEELIDYLGTQAELLRSPVMRGRALTRLANESTYNVERLEPVGSLFAEVTGHARGIWTSLVPSGPASTNREARRPFPFQVKVAEASKSSMLELRAMGAEPDSTRAFLNCLMREYLSFKREAREKTSDQAVTSVAAEVDRLSKALAAQQEELHAFQSSNNVVFLQEQGNTAGSYLAMLNQRTANLRTELRFLQSVQPEQWIAAKSAPEREASGASLGDRAMANEMLASLAGPQLELFKANQQIQLLEAGREELSRFLQPQHPKFIALNEELETQKRLARISRDEAVRQMKLRRQAIELEIRNLEVAFDEWDAKAIEASRKMADYDRIRQHLQRLQGAYDRMLALIQTVDVSRTVEQENIGILEPASPAAPLNRMARNLAIALAGSVLLGFGMLYCVGIFRDDFSSLSELREHLSETVVGQIPSISIKNHRGKLRLEVLEKQRFEFMEAFRNLRSSLLFMNNGAPRPKTILIASSVPEEGKSIVALYLASTLALGNSRVLLIDADMRRGGLHRFVGAASGPGLAEVLEREKPFANAIVQTGLENLSFLPAGDAKRNPGELVLRPEWGRLLDEVGRQFDYVVVDTPPVLATDDAAALAHKVDGILFVVRASFTSSRVASGALDQLRQRHVQVLGLILNRAVASPYEYHGYQRYRKGYRWKPRKVKHAASLTGSTATTPDIS